MGTHDYVRDARKATGYPPHEDEEAGEGKEEENHLAIQPVLPAPDSLM